MIFLQVVFLWLTVRVVLLNVAFVIPRLMKKGIQRLFVVFSVPVHEGCVCEGPVDV